MLDKKGDLDTMAKNIKITDLEFECKFEKNQLLVSKNIFQEEIL